MGLLRNLAVVAAIASLTTGLPQAGGSIAYSGSSFSHGDGGDSGGKVRRYFTAGFLGPKVDHGRVSPSTDPTNAIAHGQNLSNPDDEQHSYASSQPHAVELYTISAVSIHEYPDAGSQIGNNATHHLLESVNLTISTDSGTGGQPKASVEAHCNLTWTPNNEEMTINMTCRDQSGAKPPYEVAFQQKTYSALSGFKLYISKGSIGTSPTAEWVTEALPTDPKWKIERGIYRYAGPVGIMYEVGSSSPPGDLGSRPSTTSPAVPSVATLPTGAANDPGAMAAQKELGGGAGSSPSEGRNRMRVRDATL